MATNNNTRRRKICLPDSINNKKPCTIKDKNKLLHQHPLDQVLDFCGGEIVENVPNIQLLHMILVYGQCGGGEGLCIETMQGCQTLQNQIYDKFMRSVVSTLSPAQACNLQSMIVPNNWTDTFCRLLLDTAIPTAFASNHNDAMTQLEYICNKRCFELRLVDSPTMIQQLKFPAASEDVHQWVKNSFIKWLCNFYECYSLCCFEHMRLSSMGLKKHEMKDWQMVVNGIVSKRIKLLKSQIIPSIQNLLSSSGSTTAKVMEACWAQAVTLQQDLSNIVIFYVSYAIQRKGEDFLRCKFQQLQQGKLQGSQYIYDLMNSQVSSFFGLHAFLHMIIPNKCFSKAGSSRPQQDPHCQLNGSWTSQASSHLVHRSSSSKDPINHAFGLH